MKLSFLIEPRIVIGFTVYIMFFFSFISSIYFYGIVGYFLSN